ncbi:MAG: hypothetical protein DRP45_02265 [Candidatus Zixiibacteriota bacterium]|nr:MAG: hypothetical protein DRP45_02265 [candidate division Zixibacteria bacterium]
MEISLAYGNAEIVIEIPDGVTTDQFGVTSAESPVSYEEFAASFAAGGCEKMLSCASPLIVVNDGHRSTPTSQVLGFLDKRDDSLLDRARFLIATGTHPAPTDEHLRTIFGPFLDRVRNRVVWHDATDESLMMKIGQDHFGEDVFVNRLVQEHELVLVISSVEPHYFAGFTGGRKSFLPGLTNLATVERNHNLANSLEAAPLKIAGNPVAEHMDELLHMLELDKLLSVLVVVDAGGNVASIHCERVDRAFDDAIASAAKLYAHTIDDQYDLVLAEVLPPLDKSLYQAQKVLENTQAAVRDGGAAVVVSACSEGIGSRRFYELANWWNAETNQSSDGVQYFGSHKLSRVNTIRKRIDVRLHSNLESETVRHVYYEPVDDLGTFVNERLSSAQQPARLAVVHDAGQTVLHKSN